jgi:hypothetical protein
VDGQRHDGPEAVQWYARGENGCSPAARGQGVLGKAGDDQGVRARGFGSAQELWHARAELAAARCGVMAACFPQHDLGEAQLFRQELERLMVDNGSERPGRYLCRTA